MLFNNNKIKWQGSQGRKRMKIQYRAPGNVKDEKEIQEKGQGR